MSHRQGAPRCCRGREPSCPDPPHRSRRAAFPQRAPLSGSGGPAFGVWQPIQFRLAHDGGGRPSLIRRRVRRGPAVHVPLEWAPSLHPLRRRRAGLVRGLHQYYAPIRLLTPVHRRRALLRASRRGPQPPRRRASMRSPRFRRLPFMRDGVSDLGRASEPRIAVPHMLPSTGQTVSASATLKISRLNSPPHMIAVYASAVPSPTQPQHSLSGGLLRPYPRGTLTRWNTPASSWRT